MIAYNGLRVWHVAYTNLNIITNFKINIMVENRYEQQCAIHDVIRWVSFCEELPNEGDDIVIFEKGYGAWSCKFEFDKDANYSKSVWCFQPCV